jgi:hypothetical protein
MKEPSKDVSTFQGSVKLIDVTFSWTLPGTEDWVAWDAPWPCSLVVPRLDIMKDYLVVVL